MKEIYVRTATHWVKVSRRRDKTFVFALGYKGDVEAYRVTRYGPKFMPTISDAREHAAYIVNNP